MQVVENQLLNVVGGGQVQCTGGGNAKGMSMDCSVKIIDTPKVQVTASAGGNIPGGNPRASIVVHVPF